MSLVDEVRGDPTAGEGDDALRSQIQKLVVSPEWRGLAVRGPVGAADHLVDAVPLGRARGELVAAGTAAVKQDHVGVLGACAVQRRPDRVRIAWVRPGGWGTR